MSSKSSEEFRAQLLMCLERADRFALKLTRDPQEAQDMVQDAVEKALRNWQSFDRDTNMQAWLNQIIKNNFLDKMKSHDISKTDRVGEDTQLIEGEISSSTLAHIEVEEIQSFLFDKFSVNERSVVMSWAEGFSYDEIALDLGLSRSNVAVLLCRARKRLHERFGGYSSAAI